MPKVPKWLLLLLVVAAAWYVLVGSREYADPVTQPTPSPTTATSSTKK
jgi:hypothetical protein